MTVRLCVHVGLTPWLRTRNPAAWLDERCTESSPMSSNPIVRDGGCAQVSSPDVGGDHESAERQMLLYAIGPHR
jgi:hypothetical protein